jgi:2-oxoglutarate ferredoxin oxidoreductase subunit delta
LRGTVELDENSCKGCELCVDACKPKVLAMGTHINALGYKPATVVNGDKCTGCRACYLVCPEVVFTVYQAG